MRGLEKCRSEFSLMALDYNFIRLLNIHGVDALVTIAPKDQEIARNMDMCKK